ncbi:MAG: DNA recombination protein RmuC [Nitrospirae bacterium]|nr:MAG: DNA recombination protein RmuC [Nitrospirota bacterium]
MNEYLYLIIGLLVGGTIVYMTLRLHFAKRLLAERESISDEKTRLLAELESEKVRVGELRARIEEINNDLNRTKAEKAEKEREFVEASTRLEEAEKNLKEQKELIEQMKKDMTDVFQALSSRALRSSNEEFIKLAREQLGGLLNEAKGRLGQHREAMEGIVRPLQDALRRYEEEIKKIETKRREDYGSLTQQIENLMSTHQRLQKETDKLVTALRRPQVSGRWGQFSLRRVAELAGMTDHCDFYEERSFDTEDGRLRPDMVVKLPNNRVIVVDAKAPVDAYLNALTVEDEAMRKDAMNAYVNQVRQHMNGLSSKAYWDRLPESPEFVVMYLPGESFFSAAIENDPALIEDGSMKRVIIATPTTFIALLKAVAYGWQQAELTKNAEEISRLGKELYERFAVAMEHYLKTGENLKRAVESYNRSVRSIETRLLQSARRFKELGISSKKDIPLLEEIDERPREITGNDLED